MRRIILTVDLPDHLAHFNPDRVAALVAAASELECTGRWDDGPRSEGAELIAAERRRHVDVEGWTPEHDAEHDRCELLHAAQNYMELGEFIAYTGRDDAARYYRGRPPREAVWPPGWSWKPDHTDPVRNLVKAGACIAAEIDRLMAADVTQETGRA
jgi:hypothetical protein